MLQYFMGEVRCSDCRKILCANGVGLEQYYEYNGSEERRRQNTNKILWYVCASCWFENDNVKKLEETSKFLQLPQEALDRISKWHTPRIPGIKSAFASSPGFFLTAEYKRERQRELSKRRPIKTWLDSINKQIKEDLTNEWFDASMEVPNTKDERYIAEVMTIRCMIRLNWDYKNRLFRGRRYLYRKYGNGEVAYFHKLVKEGYACINCGGIFPGQFQVNPEWRGIPCNDCTNEKTLPLSINQNLGVI